MDIGVIAKRYAKALLLFAQEEKAEDIVYKEVLQVIKSYDNLVNIRRKENNGNK